MDRIIYALAVILTMCFPGIATSQDCWEITDIQGSVSTVSYIWNIKDKIGGDSALIGKLNDKDIVLPVSKVRSLTVIDSDSGWLGFLKSNTRKMDIVLEDGKKGVFESDNNLFTSKDGDTDQNEISLADLKSVVRCKQTPVVAEKKVAAKPGMQAVVPVAPVADTSSFDSVQMKNGDILYGTITSTEFRWKADYATLLIPVANIRNINITDNKLMQGVVELKTGGRVSGTLESASLTIQLNFGQTIDMTTDNIKEVSFSNKR